jgi:hypothetical protein
MKTTIAGAGAFVRPERVIPIEKGTGAAREPKKTYIRRMHWLAVQSRGVTRFFGS